MPDRSDPESFQAKDQTFGGWLLTQSDREGWVGELAKTARADPSFPKEGNPGSVRRHLREQLVGGDVFQAVDDAEWDWVSP